MPSVDRVERFHERQRAAAPRGQPVARRAAKGRQVAAPSLPDLHCIYRGSTPLPPFTGCIAGPRNVPAWNCFCSEVNTSRCVVLVNPKSKPVAKRNDYAICQDCKHRKTFSLPKTPSWVVVCTTAPREVPTLHRCLASVSAAGWPDVHLFAEPKTDMDGVFGTIHQNSEILGGYRNWRQALDFASRQDVDMILILQDDVILSRGSREYVEREWPADTELWSLYMSSGLMGHKTKPRGHLFYGALAIAMPIETARRILDDQELENRPQNNFDVGIGEWCDRTERPLHLADPSLGQHIGDTSTMHGPATNTGKRHSLTFIEEAPPDQTVWYLPRGNTTQWAVGLLTTLQRFSGLATQTLEQIEQAGFEDVHWFADGTTILPTDGPFENVFPHRATCRQEPIGPWSNWLLGMMELYLRNPEADLYVMFEDDILVAKNTREYLETIRLPVDGYFSLFCSAVNGAGAGFFRARVSGMGAQALLFHRAGLRSLLTSTTAFDHRLRYLGHNSTDGALAQLGSYLPEYTHSPSLVQHINPIQNPRITNAHSTLGHKFTQASNAPTFSDTVHVRSPEILLVGWSTASGLGYCNRDLNEHIKLTKWLAPKHPKFPYIDSSGMRCKRDQNVLKKHLPAADVMLSVETLYFPDQYRIAHDYGVLNVVIPMLEWTPVSSAVSETAQWVKDVDLFLCPTRQCYDALSREHPGRCVFFPWPIDTKLFEFRQRTRCSQFVYVHGNGGWHDRKAGDLMAAAAALVPDIPLIVYSQVGKMRANAATGELQWPEHVDVRGSPAERAVLYADGDVLVAPHRYNGLGLEYLEAQSCGMPVISTDGPPMNEYPAIRRLPCKSKKVFVERQMDSWEVEPQVIADAMTELFETDISEQSLASREFALTRSWSHNRLVEEITKLVRP